MPLEIDFWKNFGAFWEGKWRYFVTNIGPSMDVMYKKAKDSRTTKNMICSIKLRFRGFKNRSKFDQKSIKKWHPKWSASWHRFFLVSDGFKNQVGSENRAKIDPKRHQKIDAKQKPKKIDFLSHLGASWGVRRSGNQRGAGATQAPTASWCPQGTPLSKKTSIEATSTG